MAIVRGVGKVAPYQGCASGPRRECAGGCPPTSRPRRSTQTATGPPPGARTSFNGAREMIAHSDELRRGRSGRPTRSPPHGWRPGPGVAGSRRQVKGRASHLIRSYGADQPESLVAVSHRGTV